MYRNGTESVEKSAKKIWKFHFFAVTLHPLSRLKMLLATTQRAEKMRLRLGSEKFFEKKVSQKFGSYKNLPYLCTTFALIKKPRCKNEREGRKVQSK